MVFHWMTASLLRSPGLFSVFCPISTKLLSIGSPPVLRFPILPATIPSLWGWFQASQLQLETSSTQSCSPSFFFSRTLKLNSLIFFKFPKSSAHASGAWRHSHPLVQFYLGFLFWHLWMTHPPREHLHSCCT